MLQGLQGLLLQWGASPCLVEVLVEGFLTEAGCWARL